MKRNFSPLKTSEFSIFEWMKNIFLVGYMGVGKTTIGKKIAKELGMYFIDLDRFISENENASIPEIMKSGGEAQFRLLEQRYLLELISKKNVLVSTGGGTPCFFDNMKQIISAGTSIYLKMDVKSLTNRLIQNTESRPLIAGKNKEQLTQFITNHLEERRPYYEMAHFEINALNFSKEKISEIKNMLVQKDRI
ncbi:MAG: shikimate kinase [Salibacteraceae bacterium]